jgi:hypothetical protein
VKSSRCFQTWKPRCCIASKDRVDVFVIVGSLLLLDSSFV